MKNDKDLKMVHNLKTWPQNFEDIKSGIKTFEVRYNDRDFQVGDYLELLEYDPVTGCYTSRRLNCIITYKLDGGQFGIKKGYVCLGIELLKY